MLKNNIRLETKQIKTRSPAQKKTFAALKLAELGESV
jgi:hypothetical protein